MVHKLTEYMKLDEIVLIPVLGFVEDEKTFKNLTYMKTSHCLTTHLVVCVHLFSYNFFSLFIFLAYLIFCIKMLFFVGKILR